jgi:hypothetical protein
MDSGLEVSNHLNLKVCYCLVSTDKHFRIDSYLYYSLSPSPFSLTPYPSIFSISIQLLIDSSLTPPQVSCYVSIH